MLDDVWVVSRSPWEAGMWVARSIEHDQIGMGETRDEAYAALKEVMVTYLELLEKDEELARSCGDSDQ